MAIIYSLGAYVVTEMLFIHSLFAGLQQAQGGAAISGRERSFWPRNDRAKDNVLRWSTGENAYSKDDFSTLHSPSLKPVIFPSNGSRDSREEVEALMAFKQALNVSSRSTLSSWNATDANPCQWKGITCYEHARRVYGINLAGMGLKGRISPSLGRLKYLHAIDFSNNFFTGEIPTSILNCTNLGYLTLGNNTLTGQIPSQIGALSQLLVLNLSTNFYIRGRVPSSIGNCSLLRQIRLEYTLVEGEIPETIGQLSHLVRLSLLSTLVNGSLPRSLGNCSSLQNLDLGNSYLTYYGNALQPPVNDQFSLSNTQLGGTLPEEMANLKNLREIFIEKTTIHGPLPSWLANLTSLISINLPSNLFSGQIPEALGSLPLAILDLYANNMSGVIPGTISNCSNLVFLDLGSLHLGGAIPSDIGLLTKVGYLRLDDNQLIGKIPPSLSNCSSVEDLGLGDNPTMESQSLPEWMGSLVNADVLYLSNMELVGHVPLQITGLPFLSLLFLDGNHFHGPIPKQLGNLSTLEELWLGSNDFAGEIPLELWELRQLTGLYLEGNKLTGSLSGAIGNLSYLEELDCHSNLLSGALPSRILELSSLERGYFQDNKFNGHVPAAIGNMSALQILNMSSNQISGPIPPSMHNLSILAKVAISENQLTGAIPASLMRCTQLIYLDLHSNLLTGSVPDEIGQLQVLEQLYLQKNQLSGALPDSLGLCSHLVAVDFSYNAFGDVLTREVFGNASALVSLDLSHNFFSGDLPKSFGELTAVTTLHLSNNNFSGSIPPDLGSCLSLVALDLSENDFSGVIPRTLASLEHLALLNLSYNNLEGPLPDSGLFSSDNFSAAWFLGNPKLCGSRLPKNCSTSGAGRPCKGLGCKAAKLAVIISCVACALLVVAMGTSVALWLWIAEKRNKVQDGVVTFGTEVHLSEQDLLKVMVEPDNLIATGASSSVYRADLSDGKTIAVKVLIRSSNSVGDAFYDRELDRAKSCMYREANTLSKLKHRNVLKVLGMVSSARMTGLMLEFMPLGSLDDQLHGAGGAAGKCSLHWEQRLDIAVGIAQGLVYLHEEVQVPIIHTDLKPMNILLDADMTPKLGDFGISRFTNANSGDEVTVTQVCGTFGYIPPEYASNTRVSTRGDVYSYGVLLLELVTRRRPNTLAIDQVDALSSSQGSKDLNPLVDWVLRNSVDLRSWSAVVDPLLLGEDKGNETSNKQMQQMKLLLQVGLLCTQTNPQSRPRMYDVLAMLVHIQRLGEDPVNTPTLAELAVESTEASSSQPSNGAHDDANEATM